MNVNIGRLRRWDYGVLAAFVLTIVGVSIPWWKAKVGDLLGGIDGAPSLNASGWDIDAGAAAFSFALFALLWVAVKVFLPANQPLPKWYAESWGTLGFGGIMTLCGFVGCVDAPYGGFDFWAWRPGSLLTLIAGLAVVGLGYMMLKDKSGDYGHAEMPKINVIKADGTTTQVGGASLCAGCGKTLGSRRELLQELR